jgi:hypothetical protein
MKARFLVFGVIWLNFLFCGDSFGQKRVVLEQMKPLEYTIFSCKYFIESYHEYNHCIQCKNDKIVKLKQNPTSTDCRLPRVIIAPIALETIIYFNDQLYKKTSNYFPGK